MNTSDKSNHSVASPSPVQVAPLPVPEIYDDLYAEHYDAIWWDSEMWARDSAHHLDLLDGWLESDTRWLDIGCGTGWMLRHFPHVTTRAGVDLSEHVLERAQATCPGVEFRLGDVLEAHDPWVDQWDLVTCTGQPWSYLRNLEEFDAWVQQMAAWTAPDGMCFNQVPDILELTGHATRYYLPPEEPPVGLARVLAVHWAMDEPFTKHGPMIWPSLDVWVRLFAKYFMRVEVLHADPSLELRFPRAILASGKRQPGEAGLEIVYEPPPAKAADPPAAPEDLAEPTTEHLEEEARQRRAWEEDNRRAWEENERAWAENQEKWAENALSWQEHQQHLRRETERADAAEARLAALAESDSQQPPNSSNLTTRELTRALLVRLRPGRALRRLRAR